MEASPAPGPRKDVLISANPTTHFVVFENQRPRITPMDSLTIYDPDADHFQSLSLDLYRGPDKKFGVSATVDFWDRYGVVNGVELHALDTSQFRAMFRMPVLCASVRDLGILNDARAGRQNVYTGFHFYKLDGASAAIDITESTTADGFLGTRVDSTMVISSLTNLAGFARVKQDFGGDSHLDLSFERALVSRRIIANDLGLAGGWSVPNTMVLDAKSLTSFGDKIKESEARLNAEYGLSPGNTPYAGYQYHNPLFTDSMSIYYFDVFNFQKFYAGWRFKPFAKHSVFLTGEYNLMFIRDLKVHNVKVGVSTPYAEASCSVRAGDLSGAGQITLSGNCPVYKMVSVGAGIDYAKLDIYFGNGASDFFDYYGFVNVEPPFLKTSRLRLRVEDRSDPWVFHDVRVLVDLIIGYSNQRGWNYPEGNR